MICGLELLQRAKRCMDVITTISALEAQVLLSCFKENNSSEMAITKVSNRCKLFTYIIIGQQNTALNSYDYNRTTKTRDETEQG